MTQHELKQNKNAWQKAAPRLTSLLATDWHNGQILSRPWSRAAHSMVQGWRIRMSRPPASGTAKAATNVTWKELVRSAVGVLACKVSRTKQSGWQRWAAYRMSDGSRYIPKAKRT